MRRVRWVAVALGVLILTGGGRAAPAQPVNALGDDPFVREWIVIGPFPNAVVAEPLPDGSTRTGYYTDYLTGLGGEANAVLKEGTKVTYTGDDGQKKTVTAAAASASETGIIGFHKILDTGAQLAYAFCYVESEKDRTAHFAFGSNDCAKVWVNGELAHAFWSKDGRGLQPWSDEFEVELHKGKNPVMVKVEDMGGAQWAFALQVYDAKDPGLLQQLAKRERKQELRAFQRCWLKPAGRGGWMFPPGEFPELVWDRPEVVAKAVGEFPLEVRWFDAELKEVEAPERAGRYAAVVDATTPKGTHVRRAVTFYCRPEEWNPWRSEPKAHLEYLPGSPINKQAYEEWADGLALHFGWTLLEHLSGTPEGALLMAGLAEMEPLGREALPTETPWIADADYHVALKLNLLGLDAKRTPLAPPRERAKPAPVLRAGTFAEAGVDPKAVERIRELCTRWYAETKEPFVVCLARHGVIFMHEAFGSEPDRPIELDTPMALASLTKLLTGLLLAQFVDQELIGIDEPVGKYLPDFPVEGDKALTLRHCLTHTSGLSGHGEWGGLLNPWLDNVIANGLEYLEPGKAYEYNGMGFDLAGKVMEAVAGKCAQRLMYEHLFEPLGVKHFGVWDFAFSAEVSAEELARFGQLLLNRGAYGDREFFSPATFETILPRPLSDFYPGVDAEYGMGIAWMKPSPWTVWDEGAPRASLSENTIGHGAASGAILRVDPDNDLVVAQARNQAGGEKSAEYSHRFIAAVAASLKQ